VRRLVAPARPALPVPILVATVLLAVTAVLPAQTPAPPAPFNGEITLEIWSIDDTIIHGDRSAEERLLREAQYTLSGMIYGWNFVYTPEYADRGVTRYFALEPVAGIPWGDPRLSLRAVQGGENTLYGQIDFRLSPTDLSRLDAWNDLAVARSVGIGGAPLQQGLTGKLTAIEEAIHQAIRDYLRSVTFNRPREVVGSVILERPPRIRTVSGTYEAQVRARIHIDEIVEYRVF
jgi:hypothetical protein